jgi:hypothetical protein
MAIIISSMKCHSKYNGKKRAYKSQTAATAYTGTTDFFLISRTVILLSVKYRLTE